MTMTELVRRVCMAGRLGALLVAVGAPVSAQQSGSPAPAAETLAQRLVRELVAQHRGQLVAIELAVVTPRGCATIAATERKDVGERCDADEEGPMRTGEPSVEEPSRADPVYDVTQPLHDASGRLIGAVGMDIAPHPGQHRDAVVAFARTVLRELEARIPSKEQLLAPAAP